MNSDFLTFLQPRASLQDGKQAGSTRSATQGALKRSTKGN
jgi:hypothetical protein